MEQGDRAETVFGAQPADARDRRADALDALRRTFEEHLSSPAAGAEVTLRRSRLVDDVLRDLWSEIGSVGGVALVATGGYGRQELFPYSDVDLMFLLDGPVSERAAREPLHLLNQRLWDAGMRVSMMTRRLAECDRFDPENVEFALSLLDARLVAGDPELGARLTERAVPRMLTREHRRIAGRLVEATRARHTKFGSTLFHLEPNVKDCPGGLRDAHVCAWLARLQAAAGQNSPPPTQDFLHARSFLVLVRAFLHFRHGRDDNTLDWGAQDAAAELALGAGAGERRGLLDAAYWMRLYFRHARTLERHTRQALEPAAEPKPGKLRSLSSTFRLKEAAVSSEGFELKGSRLSLAAPGASDPAHDPAVVFAMFASMARTGTALSAETERRVEAALPVLSEHLEDGPNLWQHLQAILLGRHAADALRAMHAQGLLELVIPEFHGIDALVIRDAYHRYTVDEHTFVLIDRLHALGSGEGGGFSFGEHDKLMERWSVRFGPLFRDLPHPGLLLLAALLHDTGKSRAGTGHAEESARMAMNVAERLELDAWESGLVVDLIRHHLEMSAALRRDVFDAETVRAFAARVSNPEALKMLTLFTWADIAAVNPDALTPWKAENLWRLYNATASFLDRSVDEDRVAAAETSADRELLQRIYTLVPGQTEQVNRYLEGFPRRYLETRNPETVASHFRKAAGLPSGATEVELRYAPGMSELTLVTFDRPRLFATIAGVLAAWGMNVVTADAFSNAHGVVVDSFRFTDTFRTLEWNASERDRLVAEIRELLTGPPGLTSGLAARRRTPRPPAKVAIQTRIEFDHAASSHSTLLEVSAQDSPGLLRAISTTLAESGCNIEVALIDTEGENAIDVFYITRRSPRDGKARTLTPAETEDVRVALLEAIADNAA